MSKKTQAMLRSALSVKEISARYGLTEERILHWINHPDQSKRLQAVNISNGDQRPRWLIEIPALQEFFSKRLNVTPSDSKPARTPRRREKPTRKYV